MAHHQKRSWLIALVGAIAGLVGAYLAYILLGFFTGVVAMCSWAPTWWVHVYFALSVLVAVGAASRSSRSDGGAPMPSQARVGRWA